MTKILPNYGMEQNVLATLADRNSSKEAVNESVRFLADAVLCDLMKANSYEGLGQKISWRSVKPEDVVLLTLESIFDLERGMIEKTEAENKATLNFAADLSLCEGNIMSNQDLDLVEQFVRDIYTNCGTKLYKLTNAIREDIDRRGINLKPVLCSIMSILKNRFPGNLIRGTLSNIIEDPKTEVWDKRQATLMRYVRKAARSSAIEAPIYFIPGLVVNGFIGLINSKSPLSEVSA